LKTLPYFSLRDDWKPEPCGSHTRDHSQGSQTAFEAETWDPTLGAGHLPLPTHTDAHAGFVYHGVHKIWEVEPRE
jgi:hypothetical protein